MNVQIFGVKNSSDTRKAERFFKERNIAYHFRDLSEKGISKGELDSIKRKFKPEELLDMEGKQFIKRNLKYMTYDLESELLTDPLLFKTPIIRCEGDVTIGYAPDVWKNWIDKFKGK